MAPIMMFRKISNSSKMKYILSYFLLVQEHLSPPQLYYFQGGDNFNRENNWNNDENISKLSKHFKINLIKAFLDLTLIYF